MSCGICVLKVWRRRAENIQTLVYVAFFFQILQLIEENKQNKTKHFGNVFFQIRQTYQKLKVVGWVQCSLLSHCLQCQHPTETLVQILASLLPIQFPANVLEKTEEDNTSVWAPGRMWEARKKLLFPSFSLPNPSHIRHLGSELGVRKPLSFSLFLSISL